MDNRKLVIIGATSGIGRELARNYAAKGYKVGITGRRNHLLESLRAEFTTDTTKDLIVSECFDVTGPDNIAHMENLISRLGGLDLMIYNSGYGEVSEELSWAIDKKIINTNVNGFAEIVNWAFNFFLKQGHGHIAATSSIASVRGNSFSPAYGASKAFMSNYLEGIYIKAKKLKAPIYITDIQPGFVNTKPSGGNKQFWVVPVAKAAREIVDGIDRKKFRLYISRRWIIVASLLQLVPRFIYRRFG